MAIEILSPWDAADYLTTPEARAEYLAAMLEDAADDPACLAKALDDVARSLDRDASSTRHQRMIADILASPVPLDVSRLHQAIHSLGFTLTIQPHLPSAAE